MDRWLEGRSRGPMVAVIPKTRSMRALAWARELTEVTETMTPLLFFRESKRRTIVSGSLLFDRRAVPYARSGECDGGGCYAKR